jgi:hypothetical protein
MAALHERASISPMVEHVLRGQGSRPPLCAGCGQRIGVYEPIWHVSGAAGAERTSWLRLADGPPAGALWHAECAEGDGVAGG